MDMDLTSKQDIDAVNQCFEFWEKKGGINQLFTMCQEIIKFKVKWVMWFSKRQWINGKVRGLKYNFKL